MDLEAANRELSRRYKRALQVLKIARRALNRVGFEDGPTDAEAIEAIDDVFYVERIEREFAKLKKKAAQANGGPNAADRNSGPRPG